MSHARYIDKTREYYLGEGYSTPYRWAHFDDVPFTHLPRPLARCRVGLVTTSDMVIRGCEAELAHVEDDPTRPTYSLPMDTPTADLESRKASYDRHATTLDDVDAYLPLTHLRRLVEKRPCERLKDYLRSAGVAFRVRDVMADQEAADFLESRDIFATPVLSIDGELIVGFRRERIDALLGLGGT